MKLRTLIANVIFFGVAASLTSVHAQTPDPCTMFTCWAGMPGVVGATGGPGCTAAIAYWHSPAPAGLAIYHPPQGFNPPASAALRRSFMSVCKGVKTGPNAAILQTIISEYGYIP